MLILRVENNYNQKRLYHKAYFSLDCEDGIEYDALEWMQPSPEKLFIQAEEQAHAELFLRRLERALATLGLFKGGILHQYREYIIENLQNEYTQSEVIRQLQHLYGYSRSRTLANRYMEDFIKQYGLTVNCGRTNKVLTI